MKPWYAVDLDGTLAIHNVGSYDPAHIGLPVQPMLERVRQWLTSGRVVKIFTARADQPEAVAAIRKWLDKHGLEAITEITNKKDYMMVELWDDRAVGVVVNKGIPCEAMIAHELALVLESAGVKVEQGMTYADASRITSAKVAKAIKRMDEVSALVDAAHDAMTYVKTESLERLELRGEAAKAIASLIGDIERAKRATAKAHKAIKA